MNRRIKEVGSFFEAEELYEEWFLNDKNISSKINIVSMLFQKTSQVSWFNSGRSAIGAVIDEIEKTGCTKTVLLPAYLCNSMVVPFLIRNWKIFFYTLNKDLSPNLNNLLDLLKTSKPSVILLLPYYGQDTINKASTSLFDWKFAGVCGGGV